MRKHRVTYEPRYAPLDWHYIITRGLVIGILVGVALVIAIPFVIVANAR